MSNVMDHMPEGVDPCAMNAEEFQKFMETAVKNFVDTVNTHPDYQFVRDGGKMGLGDWFEQFGCQTGVL